MDLIFPSIQVNFENKQYYVAVVKLGLVYKLFIDAISDLEKLNESEINELKNHIIENKEKPIIKNLVVFFDNEYNFSEIIENTNYGNLKLSLLENNFYTYESKNFQISLGMALSEEKSLKEQNITITFFPVENFNNLENLILKLDIPNKSLVEITESNDFSKNDYQNNTYYEVTEYLFDNFKLLKSLVDFDNKSLSLRSKNLFTLSAIIETNSNLLEGLALNDEDSKKLVLDFWSYLFEVFSDWGRYKPSEIREKFIHSSLIVLSSIASFSSILLSKDKASWKNYLYGINKINWSKENSKWVEIGILKNIRGSIISSIDGKNNLIEYLKEKLKFESEEISSEEIYKLIEKEYLMVVPYLSFNRRKDGNISIKGNNYIFCYLDFIDNGRILVARLKITPSHPDLRNYIGLWRKSTAQHQIGSWGNNVIDLPMVSSKRINEYIEIMEIVRKLNTF